MANLSASEIAHYQQNGYVVPSYRLPEQKVRLLQATLNELIKNNPGVRPEKLVSAHIEKNNGQDNGEGVRGSAEFLRLAQDPELVELVSQVIGDDVILWGCHVFCKPAGDGYETPWHQDGHYWPIKPLATCTVWVAIEESVIENGCLRVIPNSLENKKLHEHLQEDRQDLTLNLRTSEDAFDVNTAKDIELQPGQMSLHDVFTIHGANPNTSTKRRTGVALRYMPGSSLFDRNWNPAGDKTGVPVAFATRPIWLLKGQDQTGQNDFSVGH